MIALAHAGGAGDFELLAPALSDEELDTLLFNASQLLVARGCSEAAGLLASMDFQLFTATNYFGDDFTVLYAKVSFMQYEYLRENSRDDELKRAFSEIREVLSEIGPFVRFIACELDPACPPRDWRTDLENAIAVISANQALFTYRDSQKIVHEGLNFRSKTEAKIFDSLVVKGVLVFPLPVAVMGKPRVYREPDFLVCYNGKWGILEIHGDKWHPPETAAQEHERRRQFMRLGVTVYEIFDAKRCWTHPEQVVEEFLAALDRS